MDPKTFIVSIVCLALLTINSYSLAQESLPNVQVSQPNPNQPGEGCGSLLQSDILKQLLEGYDKEVRPPPGDSPTLVTGSANILNIPTVDEEKRYFTLNLFFWQEWNDSRLNYQKLVRGCPKFRYIPLTTEKGVASIWKPNLFYPQQVGGGIIDVLQTNRGARIFPDGSVLYSVHMTVSLFCSGKGGKAGEFLCPFKMFPYGPTLHEMRFAWKQPNPIQMDNSNMDMPNHVLGPIDTTVNVTKLRTGHFPTFVANFHFLRKACMP